MYQRLMGNVRRLKNIDGTTTKIAYAQIPINYNFGANFTNTKINNQFVIERDIAYDPNSGVKINVMCNVIKIELPDDVTGTITLKSTSKKYWNVDGNPEIGTIPNLNDETTYNLIYNTFNNFKNKNLRKQLNTILFNLTHGSTPYANDAFQNETFGNIFATCYDSDVALDTPITDNQGYSIVCGEGFPQPYLIIYSDSNSFNFIGFINTTPPNQHLILDHEMNTFPTYGMMVDPDSMNILNIYYCTYKGV